MVPAPRFNERLEERIELVPPERERGRGISLAIGVSVALHLLLTVYLVRNYRPVSSGSAGPPIARYVELMRQQPKEFVEAPGPKVASAPITAPWSNANRKASMPKPTGDQPTLRPGDRGTIYTPPAGSQRATAPAQSSAPEQAAVAPQQAASPQPEQHSPAAGFAYRDTSKAAAASVDWRNAIREVGKVASLGSGQQGIDLNGMGAGSGGETGFAESGPISFETQWYDWGDYAQSMVSRIRVNWYGNMPQLIRTGMKGLVKLRFTIRRSGAITDVQILEGSGVPPYDFAAKKAIELSSPLNPLPKDFPKDSERVTAHFYYNLEPPPQ